MVWPNVINGENAVFVGNSRFARLNLAVKIAIEAGDNVSRQLFDKILLDEDQHVDYLEGELHAIGKIGIERYLARQID